MDGRYMVHNHSVSKKIAQILNIDPEEVISQIASNNQRLAKVGAS